MTAATIVLGIVGALALCGSAAAQHLNPFAACKADINSLCQDAPSGIAGRLQCLKSNQDKLSPECIGTIKAIIGVVQERAAAITDAPKPVKACQQDIAALCPDVAAGDGARIRCLRDNMPKLSPQCAESLKVARTRARSALQACEADRSKLCGSAGSKPAEQLKCLRERTADLSVECRQFISDVKAVGKAAGKSESGPAPKPQPAKAPAASAVTAPPGAPQAAPPTSTAPTQPVAPLLPSLAPKG